MSIAATNWAWSIPGQDDKTPHGIPNATIKLVLLKHADHAHDDGTHTFQSIEKVAKYALCSRRTAQRANEWLLEHGYMREGDQSVIPDHYERRRRPIAYELAMGEARRQEWEAANAAGANTIREAAKTAGAKGAAAKGQVSTGDKMASHDSVSTGDPENSTTGDNLTLHTSNDTGVIHDTSGVTNGAEWGDTDVTQTTQEPSLETTPLSLSATADAAADEARDDDPTGTKNDRADVERVCRHLQERMVANGCKRPTITVRWRDAARLMLDADGRTEKQVHNMIEWATHDEFWRANILSLPTLREKYDQMRLRAIQEAQAIEQAAVTPRRGQIDWDAAMSKATALDEHRGQGGVA